MNNLTISDFPSLSKRGEHDSTLLFPDKRANHPRQSVVNKKSDKVELRVSGILQTPHNLLLILMTLFILHQRAFINNDSPVSGGNVAELAQVAGSDAPNRTWVFSFDPDRRAGTNCISIPLVYQLCIYTAPSVTHSSSSQANFLHIMAVKVSFQIVLFMQTFNDENTASPELDHKTSNHDDITTVKLILNQLHTMDPVKVEKAKGVLMKAT